MNRFEYLALFPHLYQNNKEYLQFIAYHLYQVMVNEIGTIYPVD